VSHLIDFSAVDWCTPAEGVRYKAFISGKQRIRLVEFSEGLIEPDWCKSGHSGYVLAGEFDISFNGTIEHYNTGDCLHIPSGEDDKHMVQMKTGGWVQLLLFEQI